MKKTSSLLGDDLVEVQDEAGDAGQRGNLRAVERLIRLRLADR